MQFTVRGNLARNSVSMWTPIGSSMVHTYVCAVGLRCMLSAVVRDVTSWMM